MSSCHTDPHDPWIIIKSEENVQNRTHALVLRSCLCDELNLVLKHKVILRRLLALGAYRLQRFLDLSALPVFLLLPGRRIILLWFPAPRAGLSAKAP